MTSTACSVFETLTTLNLPADAQLADLRESNHLLGNRASLDEEWERSGYWFFRDALPLDALRKFRAPIRADLEAIGVVDSGSEEAVWNGASMERFPPANIAGYEPLPSMVHSRRWMDFLATPAVAAFFEQVLGAPAQWVAVAEMRVNPPGMDTSSGLFTYPHQDGFYNEGYRCITAWMPLWPVSKAAGGLAVAEGMHRAGYFHDTGQPPRFPIPAGAVPEDTWRTADFHPGDVVLFDRYLPHSGQCNRSERDFRVSFDVRCILPGDPVPVLGHVEAWEGGSLVVREASGALRTLRLDEESYVRGVTKGSALRLTPEETREQYQPGQEVLVTLEEDRVVLLREPKY